METEDLSSNELETLFQQLSAELDTLAAEPFQNALLVRAALRALPLLTAGLPSPGKGASANLYFLSHLRCLVTQCCMAVASDDLDLASSIEAALTQEEKASKQVGIWLPNGNVTILVRDTARRLSAYISEPSTSDILRHYLSFFAAAPYRREIEQVRKDLARLPYEPEELFGLKLTSSFGLLDWREKLSQDCWAFWRTWYQGFLDGKPLDWKLQRRVALIDDAIWDAGPEAVAAEIERIRAEFDAPPISKERFPKHEPKSVSHLFDNRVIASASLQGLAAQVTQSIERFHAETGANALPEALEPLSALPALLLAVNSTVQNAPRNQLLASDTEDQLRAEIGRLNVKVAQLENELQKACAAKPPVFSDAFKKQLGTSLGDWKLYAALCTGLWFVSGDAEGTQRRLENLSLYHDMIFSEVSSPSKAAPAHSAATAESTVEI